MGIPTITLGSCRDMMASVMPPRSAFVDFPLGHPCGKPNDIPLQKSIIKDALAHLVSATRPGELKDMAYDWGNPFSWSDFISDVEAMIKTEGESAQDWKPDN